MQELIQLEKMFRAQRLIIDQAIEVLDKIKSKLPEVKAPVNTKPINHNVFLDFGGTEKIREGSFGCLQCAVGQQMNTNCIYCLNTVGSWLQTCSNCGYENYFEVSKLVTEIKTQDEQD